MEPKNFPKKFIWKQNNNPLKSTYEQDASNCWIYSMLNCCAVNIGKPISEKELKDYIASFGININEWWYMLTSWTLIVEFLKRYNIKAKLYWFDPLRETKHRWLDNPMKPLANAFKYWYLVWYARDCTKEVIADIKDNGSLDSVLKWITAGHATSLWFDKPTKLLKEFWSRGQAKSNIFTWKDINVFIESIRQEWIQPTFYFLALDQW